MLQPGFSFKDFMALGQHVFPTFSHWVFEVLAHTQFVLCNLKKNGGELSMGLWVCVIVSWGMAHSSSPSMLCQSVPPQMMVGHSWPGV